MRLGRAQPIRAHLPEFAILLQPGPILNQTSNSGYQSGVSSLSWPLIWDGQNRFASINVEILSVNDTVTAMTYGGATCFLIGAQNVAGGTGRVEQWGCLQSTASAPGTGSNTVSVTLSGSVACAGTAESWTGVHQTTPTESWAGNSQINVGSSNLSVTITSVANNAVILASAATSDPAAAGLQTVLNDVTGTLGSGIDECTGLLPTSSARPMAITMGAAQSGAIAGYAIRPTTAGGGGNVYSVSVSESGTAADAPTDLVIFVCTVSEAGAGADSPDSSASFISSIAEAGAALDAPSNLAVLLTSVAESGAAAETITVTATFLASIAEVGAAVDSPLDTAVMPASVGEAGAAADSPNDSMTFSCLVSEAGTGADVISDLAALVASMVEAGAGVDSITDLSAMVSGVTEAGAALDSPSTIAILVTSVSEDGAAADAPGASASFLSSLVEAGNASDIPSTGPFGPIFEVGDAVDFVTCVVTFSSSVVETGAAADAEDATSSLASQVSEAAAALDLQRSQGALVPAMVEAANALDIPDSSAVFFSIVVESANALDFVDFVIAVVIPPTTTDNIYF